MEKLRAEYGKCTIKRLLSVQLINEFGKGFSVDNLENMRQILFSISKIGRQCLAKFELKLVTLYFLNKN